MACINSGHVKVIVGVAIFNSGHGDVIVVVVIVIVGMVM